jgi:hypothetical protein
LVGPVHVFAEEFWSSTIIVIWSNNQIVLENIIKSSITKVSL